jgi:hypothetical protein
MQVLASTILYRRMLKLGTGDLLAIPDMVTGRGGESDGLLGKVVAALSLLFKRDSFVFILSILIVAQLPVLAFALYGIGTVPVLVAVVMNEYRIVQAAGVTSDA